MKLWRISQETNNSYDTYDSAVVAADLEDEAKMMNPHNGEDIKKKMYNEWVGTPDLVICEYIGEAKEGTEKGVICASYNAG